MRAQAADEFRTSPKKERSSILWWLRDIKAIERESKTMHSDRGRFSELLRLHVLLTASNHSKGSDVLQLKHWFSCLAVWAEHTCPSLWAPRAQRSCQQAAHCPGAGRWSGMEEQLLWHKAGWPWARGMVCGTHCCLVRGKAAVFAAQWGRCWTAGAQQEKGERRAGIASCCTRLAWQLILILPFKATEQCF